MALQAAAEGRGVAIAPHVLIESDIRIRSLVVPFTAMPPAAPAYYYLLGPRHAWNSVKIKRFRIWLRQQVRADAHAWSSCRRRRDAAGRRINELHSSMHVENSIVSVVTRLQEFARLDRQAIPPAVRSRTGTAAVTVLPEQELKVGIGGFGAIGRRVAQALDAGIPGLRLAAVSARDIAKAEQGMRAFTRPVPIVPLHDLAAASDIVIDAAPAAALRDMAEPALRAGRYLIVISVGALLQATDLIELARRHRAQIIVPSGALIGLDAVTAAAEGKINSVRMISRKPVQGLLGAAHLQTAGIDIAGIKEPLKVFSGTAAQAAIGFPEESQRRRRARTGRDRRRADHDRGVGRSGAHTQHPSHRSRCRQRLLQHDDREHSVGEPQNRTHYRTEHHRHVAQTDQSAARRHMSAREAGPSGP